MIKTITPIGSDGEVLAPCGRPGEFIPGRRVEILVEKVSSDEKTPLVIREALVGLKISTIFTKKQIGKGLKVPEKSRLAYAQEVIEALIAAGKKQAAEELKNIVSNELDMYAFEPGIFTVVD